VGTFDKYFWFFNMNLDIINDLCKSMADDCTRIKV
jgi:hypothetical protein